ncbi:hypothetical protein HYW11_02690 [Candidatus Peregrinibacteria bacterium]|nr:hypothetical protein [Candidatus Peregrinibacteria bacterium]
MLNSFADGFLGDLMEHDALHGLWIFHPEYLRNMPPYRLPFAIFIGRNPEIPRLLEGCFQMPNDRRLLFGNFVRWSKIVRGIHAEFPLGQIADMSHARLH